jgi:hypothetical protein
MGVASGVPDLSSPQRNNGDYSDLIPIKGFFLRARDADTPPQHWRKLRGIAQLWLIASLQINSC